MLSTSSALRVASVASFDAAVEVGGLPGGSARPSPAMDSLTPGALLAAYYRPLVAAQLEAGRPGPRREAITIAELPGIDLALGIPAAIVTIIRTLPLTGPVARASRRRPAPP